MDVIKYWRLKYILNNTLCICTGVRTTLVSSLCLTLFQTKHTYLPLTYRKSQNYHIMLYRLHLASAEFELTALDFASGVRHS